MYMYRLKLLISILINKVIEVIIYSQYNEENVVSADQIVIMLDTQNCSTIHNANW